MKTPKINYEKEYLLLHEVLLALRFASMKIVSVGSEQGGMFPINEISLDAAWLNFGTLADFVNDPLKYRIKDWAPMQLNKENVATKDINQTRYSLDDISDAVDTLAIRQEVNIAKIKDGSTTIGKTIQLTTIGLNSLNNKNYQKDYLFQRKEDRTYKSTLWTNRMMIFFTFVLALSAAIEIYRFFFTCQK